MTSIIGQNCIAYQIIKEHIFVFDCKIQHFAAYNIQFPIYFLSA